MPCCPAQGCQPASCDTGEVCGQGDVCVPCGRPGGPCCSTAPACLGPFTCQKGICAIIVLAKVGGASAPVKCACGATADTQDECDTVCTEVCAKPGFVKCACGICAYPDECNSACGSK